MTDHPPRVSFIIPAWNEAREIRATLDALAASMDQLGLAEDHERIVVDDASSDGTPEIAAEAGARVVPVECRQIAAVRNAGAAVARGRILIFVDADTRVGPEPIAAALAALDEGVAGGGARVRFDRPVPVWASLALWLVMVVSRLGRLATGCFVFCTRESFDIAGGFDERYYATEELVFSRDLRRAGDVRIVDAFVETSARKVALFGLGRILLLTLRVAVLGPSGVQRRRGLEVWYGDGAASAPRE